jgi:hypothetical protein
LVRMTAAAMRIGRVLHCKEHDQTIYVSIYDALQ